MGKITPLVTKRTATRERITQLLHELQLNHADGNIESLVFVVMHQDRTFRVHVMGNLTVGEYATAVQYLQADLQALIMHDSVSLPVET